MTASEAIALGIERRAMEMFQEETEGLTLSAVWARLDETMKQYYRTAARRELEAK